jgi:alpha-galactosidase
MRKIVFIGGGSAKFVREVVVDLFSFEELQDTHITLMDINPERVDRSARLVQKILRDRNLPATVEATTDRRAALADADYVLVTIMVGGYEHYYSDTAIPAKFGVLPTVGDTIGPGGVFRTVRTAPVLQGIVEDLKAVAPDAYLLNYANPMAMNMWAIRDSGHTRAVGLCHSIQHCVREIGQWIGVPPDEISYTAAGINHIDFYLTLQHKGRDLYQDLIANASEIVERHPQERTRFELLEYLGHFPAEGAWHQSEYYPWFRKNQALVDHYHVETFWGYNVDAAHYQRRTAEIEAQIQGETPIRYQRSAEYAAEIIHSLETNTLRTFYGNVPNQGLIANLPAQAIVEVPCLVDRNGIFPCRMGRIPPQLAAVMLPHIAVHEMAVQGALTKNRRLIRQAIQADPLTGAILTLPQIKELVNALFDENREFIADWPTEGNI